MTAPKPPAAEHEKRVTPIAIDQAIVGRHILVIDPEWRYVDLIQTALAGAECVITIIPTVDAAPETVRQSPHDAVILTLSPRTSGGPQDCRRLRDTTAGLPLLVLDGRTDTDGVGDFFDAGADAYLATSGPYTSQELRARLVALMRRLGKQRQPGQGQPVWQPTAHAG